MIEGMLFFIMIILLVILGCIVNEDKKEKEICIKCKQEKICTKCGEKI